MQSIFSIETYTCGMNKDLVCKKEEIKWNSIIKQCLLTKEDIEKHNPNWPEISDHPYIVLIVGGSISEKTNALLNLMPRIHTKQNINWKLTREKVQA